MGRAEAAFHRLGRSSRVFDLPALSKVCFLTFHLEFPSGAGADSREAVGNGTFICWF
jgi:hypothetical protein